MPIDTIYRIGNTNHQGNKFNRRRRYDYVKIIFKLSTKEHGIEEPNSDGTNVYV
jgi:hypothetical protein